MPKFQGNRLKSTRGAIASSRIRAEFSLLKKVYDTSFVNPQILGTWGNNKLVCTLKFNILDTECNAKIIYNGLDAPKCWLIKPVFNDPQLYIRTKVIYACMILKIMSGQVEVISLIPLFRGLWNG